MKHLDKYFIGFIIGALFGITFATACWIVKLTQ